MSEIENPYLNNRKDWNEVYAKEKANAAMWRMFGLINMCITTLAVGGIIYTAQLPSVVPFLFKEDASGGITALGIPTSELKVDNRILANQLATFIVALRQVPNSNEIRSNYVHQVKMMSSANLFSSSLAPMLKEQYVAMSSGTITIKITTILPIAKDTWEIDWVENKNGVSSSKYKATLNFIRVSVLSKDPYELIWNPLGIIVKDLNINQVIGD